jgi:hypothetical protein
MLTLLLACAPGSTEIGPIQYDYPLDDTLRMHEAQLIGTHNSYHVSNDNGIVQQDYTHAPLAQQLGYQGVRHFELDIWWDEASGQFQVYHVPVLDPLSVCDTLVRCLADLRGWSDFNPGHFPLVVLIEPKFTAKGDEIADRLDTLDAEVRSVWPDERRITPEMVQGDSPDLATALADHGWPTLGVLRGKLLVSLHDGDALREAYTDGNTVADRALFPEVFGGDPELPFAAVAGLDDAYDVDRIAAALARNQLVRTRADGDNEEPLAGDTSRRDAALASGAQLVSTDYPVPVDGVAYVASIPGGTPVGCNPVTAPASCSAAALEDPAFLDANGALP